MLKFFLIIVVIFTAISCSTISQNPGLENTQDNEVESKIPVRGNRILATSEAMIEKREVVVGACWDYINTVYNRAGYSKKERVTIYKSKLKGPYASADLVLPGDWLYFVNHSYHGIEHSAIFVRWTNKEKKEALMVTYAGQKKKKPATYQKYVLTNIYNIIRPKERP